MHINRPLSSYDEKEKAVYIKLLNRKLKKTNCMPFLQYHVTDHCNLNCKGCAHYAPIAEEWFANPSEFEKALIYISPYADHCFSRFELMGGEPLLHPSIDLFITLSRKYLPNMDIRIVTNGIILPQMPSSFFQVCSDNRIAIYISQYPIHLNYNNIIKQLSYFKVDFSFYGEYDDDKHFITYKLDPSGAQDPNLNYIHCGLGGRCLQIRNNRIYQCFITAYVEILNRYFKKSFQLSDNDSISLDSLVSQEKFLDFINAPSPFCKYCTMASQSGFLWEKSEKRESEWIFR